MNEHLYDAHGDETVDLSQPIDDPLIARRFLIELAINERKLDQLHRTLAAVSGEYEYRIRKLAERQDDIKRSIKAFITTNGKVSFPDVGSAYLQQRKTGITVENPDTLAAYLIEQGDKTAYKTEVDVSYIKSVAKDAFKAGELLPGCSVDDEPEPSLVIRRAA